MVFRVLELFSGIGGMHYAFNCEFVDHDTCETNIYF